MTQLEAWRGEFGNAYIKRNEPKADAIRQLTRMWARMLQNVQAWNILEVGANVGLNLRAIQNVSDATLTAIEPNELARTRLLKDGFRAFDGEAKRLPFNNDTYKLAFTAGVLIHIPPDELEAACKEICRVSSRYVLCAEYYSKEPRQLPYRDGAGMWARDFGRFYMDVCPELKVIDHGFFWTGAGDYDDLTWTLLQK